MSEFDKQELEITRLLQRSPFDDVPRPEHQDALREQVLQKFDQAKESKSIVHSWTHTFDSWRQFMRRPVPRLIAISFLCLSIVAPWLFFPGHQTKAYAFANFATALVDAKTAKFQMEVTVEGMPTQKCQSYYLAPGKYRTEMSFLGAGSISISDDETLKCVILTPLLKTAVVSIPKGRPKDQPSNDPFARMRDLLSKSRDAKDTPFKPIGEKEIDGIKTVGFRSDTGLGQFTLWGDPTTGHPIRVEAIFSGPKQNEVVMTNIEINVDLDEKLFDMTPPEGYKVNTQEVDLSPTKENDLIEAFKLCGSISNGELPDSMGFTGPMMFFFKHTKDRFKDVKEKTELNFDQMQKNMKELPLIQRGFMFATELPESADAHYAGKGVKQTETDKPIFWYRPKDSTKYRVIYADLSVKDTDAAPEVSGAERLVKPSPNPKVDDK